MATYISRSFFDLVVRQPSPDQTADLPAEIIRLLDKMPEAFYLSGVALELAAQQVRCDPGSLTHRLIGEAVRLVKSIRDIINSIQISFLEVWKSERAMLVAELQFLLEVVQPGAEHTIEAIEKVMQSHFGKISKPFALDEQQTEKLDGEMDKLREMEMTGKMIVAQQCKSKAFSQ